MCKEIKLLYCIRINGLSLVTFDTGEYLGGNTEEVSEVSSAFGYLLDAENQLLVLGNCLKTIQVVTGPACSLVGRTLRMSSPACGESSPGLMSLGSYSARRPQERFAIRAHSAFDHQKVFGPRGPNQEQGTKGHFMCRSD